jgi:hypothetical protein
MSWFWVVFCMVLLVVLSVEVVLSKVRLERLGLLILVVVVTVSGTLHLVTALGGVS